MNQDRALCCEETEVHEDAVEQVRSQLPQDEVRLEGDHESGPRAVL